MLQAVKIEKRIKDKTVFLNINADVSEGQMIALTGANGIGKTVLLECLAGQRKVTGGSILYNGSAITAEKQRELVVYSKSGLYFSPKSTIAEAMCSFAILFPNFNQAQAQQLLAQFEIPLHSKWGELSLGQKKKGEIALYISRDAAFYLFDEPFANIDYFSRQDLKKCFLEYLPEKSACVVSMNNLSGMEGYFSDIWVLKNEVELCTFDLLNGISIEDLEELYKEVYR